MATAHDCKCAGDVHSFMANAHTGSYGICAVCGTFDELLQITDNGDGTCSATRYTAGTSAVVSCASLAYGGVCNSLLAPVTIVMRRTSGAPYVQPNINQWLTNMGLAGVTVLAQALTVLVDHSPFPVPPSIAPVFFTNLKQASPLVALARLYRPGRPSR